MPDRTPQATLAVTCVVLLLLWTAVGHAVGAPFWFKTVGGVGVVLAACAVTAARHGGQAVRMTSKGCLVVQVVCVVVVTAFLVWVSRQRWG